MLDAAIAPTCGWLDVVYEGCLVDGKQRGDGNVRRGASGGGNLGVGGARD